MGCPAAPRLPLAPLEAIVRARLDRPPYRPQSPGRRARTGLPEITSVAHVAQVLGVADRTVHRWRHDGIPEDHADRLACQLGLHPALVWGRAWWDLAVADGDDNAGWWPAVA